MSLGSGMMTLAAILLLGAGALRAGWRVSRAVTPPPTAPDQTACDEGTLTDVLRNIPGGHKDKKSLRRSEPAMDAIAHDLADLILAINLYVELLKHGGDDARPSAELIGMISHLADQARSIVSRLFAATHRQGPSAGAVEASNGELSSILRQRPDIEVQIIVAENTWPVVADRRQLEIAIENLAMNARDNMATGGQLAIEIDNVSWAPSWIEQYPNIIVGDYAVITVRDTGTGMTQEQPERVSDPPHAPPYADGKAKGRLGQVYEFARQAGGDLTIESKPGSGTTVRLFLPRYVVHET